MVHGIVSQHSGFIRCYSELGIELLQDLFPGFKNRGGMGGG